VQYASVERYFKALGYHQTKSQNSCKPKTLSNLVKVERLVKQMNAKNLAGSGFFQQQQQHKLQRIATESFHTLSFLGDCQFFSHPWLWLHPVHLLFRFPLVVKKKRMIRLTLKRRR
jgi:hypothetical protein